MLARRVTTNARRWVEHGMAALLSPGAIVTGLLGVAAYCAITGVLMLAGPAWALITASAIAFALAMLLLRGMSRG